MVAESRELNGLIIVEVLNKTPIDADGWTCPLLLEENDTTAPMNIKLLNLPYPAFSSPEIRRKAIIYAMKAGKFIVNQPISWRKVNKAEALFPQYGIAHSLLGKIAHFFQKPQSVILKYMRIAVANDIGTEDGSSRSLWLFWGSRQLWRIGRRAATAEPLSSK